MTKDNAAQPGPVEQAVIAKLQLGLKPTDLQVTNESYMHSVPPGSESHFKVVAVSEVFAGQNVVARHRVVYGALAEEMAGGIHALSIEAYTPEEWQARGGRVGESPLCLGGE